MNDYKIKTGIKFNIFILIIVENSLLYHGIHEFSVWLRTGSNLTHINRFRSHSKKRLTLQLCIPVVPVLAATKKAKNKFNCCFLKTSNN